MSQPALKIGLMIAVLSYAVQDASAFGRCGCGWGGYGGYGYGYGGWGYAGYGGWYGGGYGYPAWGYGRYASNSNNIYAPRVAKTKSIDPVRSQTDSNAVQLVVDVPLNAKVVINDFPTKSTGAHRHYISKGIQPGSAYHYRVRAEFIRDGKPVTEEKTVSLTAGKSALLNFNAGADAQVVNAALAMPPHR